MRNSVYAFTSARSTDPQASRISERIVRRKVISSLNELSAAVFDSDQLVFDIQYCNERNLWLAALDGHRRGSVVLMDPRASLPIIDTLHGHRQAVNNISISPDGNRIFSGSDDCTIKMWDLRQRRCERTLEGHEQGLKNSCSYQQHQLLSAGFDGTVRWWDLNSGESRIVQRDRFLIRMRLTPDGRDMIMSRRSRGLVVVHHLDLLAAGMESPDQVNSESDPEEIYDPLFMDNYFGVIRTMGDGDRLPIHECLTRDRNQIEFLWNDWSYSAYSVELSSTGRFMISRGPHMNGESDACSVFDLHHPSIGNQLKALPGVVTKQELRDHGLSLTKVSPRLVASFKDSRHPNDMYCKATTFSSDDSFIVSPYFHGVRLLSMPTALQQAPLSHSERTYMRFRSLGRPNECIPELLGSKLATCHRSSCLVARMNSDQMILASGGADASVVFHHPRL